MKRIQHRTVSYFAHVLSNPTAKISSYSQRCTVTSKSWGSPTHWYPGSSVPNLIRTQNYSSQQSLAATGPLQSPSNIEVEKKLDSSLDGDKEEESFDNDVLAAAQKLAAADVQRKLNRLNTKEELMNFISDPKISLRYLSSALERLGTLVSQDPKGVDKKILEDQRFVDVCQRLEKASFGRVPPSIVVAREGLVKIGLNPEATVLKALDVELLWVVRRCSIRHIAQTIAILAGYLPKSEKVVKSTTSKLASNHPLVVCVEALQRRWVEISTASDFISVFRIISYVSDATRENLEDRATECVQDFNAMEMVKIFQALAVQKRRPTPLLRAMAFHIAKATEPMDSTHLSDLLRACNELTFADSLLMAKVCNDLLPEIPSVTNVSVITSIVMSLGQMRYYSKELMDVLEGWALKNMNEFRPSDYAAWILSAAVFDLQSEGSNTVCRDGAKVLEQTKSTNIVGWVNVVHALSILNLAETKFYESVLSNEVVRTIDSMSSRSIGARAKLLALNAKTKSLTGYNGPSIPNEIASSWLPSAVFPSDGKLSKVVYETLNNFLPAPKYLQGSVPLPCGVYVDAICKLNSKLDPIALEDGAKDNDKEVHKVAILVHGYPSYTQGSKQPTGITRFNTDILQLEGYEVVAVPYLEFSPQEKLIRRVQYLEHKLRNIDVSKSSISSSNENTR